MYSFCSHKINQLFITICYSQTVLVVPTNFYVFSKTHEDCVFSDNECSNSFAHKTQFLHSKIFYMTTSEMTELVVTFNVG